MRPLTGLLIDAAQSLAPSMVQAVEERHHRDLSSVILSSRAPGAEFEAVAIYVRQSGMVHSWRYPDDPFLPALTAAVDGETFFRTTHWMRPWDNDRVDGRPIVLQRLAYKPGRRAALLVTRRGSARPLLLKLLTPELFASSLNCALAIEASPLATRVTVPRLFSYSPQMNAMLYDYLPGTPIGDLDAENASSLTTTATTTLAAIHGTTAADLSAWDPIRELSRTRVMVDDLQRWHPDAGEALRPVLDQISPALTHTGRSVDTLCHGDFSARNVLYHPTGYGNTADKLAVIDWDSAVRGPPERDLAAFLGATRRLGQSRDLVVSTYGDHATQRPDLDLINIFSLYQRLLKLCRRVLRDGLVPARADVGAIMQGLQR